MIWIVQVQRRGNMLLYITHVGYTPPIRLQELDTDQEYIYMIWKICTSRSGNPRSDRAPQESYLYRTSRRHLYNTCHIGRQIRYSRSPSRSSTCQPAVMMRCCAGSEQCKSSPNENMLPDHVHPDSTAPTRQRELYVDHTDRGSICHGGSRSWTLVEIDDLPDRSVKKYIPLTLIRKGKERLGTGIWLPDRSLHSR